MSITDEQVRIALGVWFEEGGYADGLEPTSRSMRSMRQTLEAAVGGVAAESGGWATYSMTFTHAVHGTFWIYLAPGPCHIRASRCYRPEGAPLPISEDIGLNYASLESAQAAVARRIAELDAAQADTAPALQVAQ